MAVTLSSRRDQAANKTKAIYASPELIDVSLESDLDEDQEIH